MATWDITQPTSRLEFDTTKADSIGAARLPGTDYVLVSWYQTTAIMNVQAFEVNTSTGAVTAIGSPIDLETGTGSSIYGSIVIPIDANNAQIIWSGPGADGFTRLVSISSGGVVTTNGAAVEYDPAFGPYTSRGVKLDATHTMIFGVHGTSGGNAGRVVIFEVNTGAGTISVTSRTAFTGTTDPRAFFPRIRQIDDTHFMAVAAPTASAKASRFFLWEVNLSTWACTLLDDETVDYSAIYAFGEADGFGFDILKNEGGTVTGVSSHLRGIYAVLQGFSIDTSTWTFNTFPAALAYGDDYSTDKEPWDITRLSDTHFLLFQAEGAPNYEYSFRVIEYNDSTNTFTEISSAIPEPVAFNNNDYSHLIPFEEIPGFFVFVHRSSGQDGYIGVVTVEMPPAGGGANTTNFFALG